VNSNEFNDLGFFARPVRAGTACATDGTWQSSVFSSWPSLRKSVAVRGLNLGRPPSDCLLDPLALAANPIRRCPA